MMEWHIQPSGKQEPGTDFATSATVSPTRRKGACSRQQAYTPSSNSLFIFSRQFPDFHIARYRCKIFMTKPAVPFYIHTGLRLSLQDIPSHRAAASRINRKGTLQVNIHAIISCHAIPPGSFFICVTFLSAAVPCVIISVATPAKGTI